MSLPPPTLPLSGSTDWYAHYAALDEHTRTYPIIKPASPSIDIGPLVNNALQNYGAARIAPNPTNWWTLETPIEMGLGEALLGLGKGACRIRAAAGLGANPMIRYRNGNAGDLTVRGLALDGNNVATECVNIYQTAQPSAALSNPDAVNILDDLFVQNATGDAIYVGGSGAYSGNARETRVMNVVAKGNGGWGVTCASSDMFLFNNTTHGNGSGAGGYRTVTGQSGNTKITQCKAYYESGHGIDSASSRVTITGGEVQDCRIGVELGSDSFLSNTICTCSNASNAALKINGSGSTFATHMTSRNPPSGSPGTNAYALEITGSSQIIGGFINTNVLTGKYGTMWRTSTRPHGDSTIRIN